MIPILGGLGAAVSWGLSTVAASRSTRLLGSQQALAYVMLLGLGALAVLAPASGYPAHATGDAWAWAVLAGAGSAVGLSLLYQALRLGKVGVVAPIASTEGALARGVLDRARRDPHGRRGRLPRVIACGVVVVTMHGSAADVHLRPSLYALAAACLFGVNLVASAHAGDALGALWTILVARIVGVPMIALPLLLRRRLPLPGRAWWMVLFSALAEVIGLRQLRHRRAPRRRHPGGAGIAVRGRGDASPRSRLRRAHRPAPDRGRRGDRRRRQRCWRCCGPESYAGAVVQADSSSSSRRRGIAPISFFCISPPWNTISVGIERMS